MEAQRAGGGSNGGSGGGDGIAGGSKRVRFCECPCKQRHQQLCALSEAV